MKDHLTEGRIINKNMNENEEVISPMKRNREETKGYAKLSGPEIKVLLRNSDVVLGRNPKKEEDSNFIHLGEYKSISKKQARIFWDKDTKIFHIENLGKNCIIVNRKSLEKNEVVRLDNKTPIKIGPVCFYFLLPMGP